MRRGQARARSASLLVALVIAACSSDDVATAPTPDGGVDASVDAPTMDVSVSDAASDAGAARPIATSAGKDEDPSIIRAKDGTFWVAFYSNRDGNDRIWLVSSPDGETWGTPRAITSSAEHAFYPGLLQTADGRFHVTWWAGEVGDGGKLVGRIRYSSSTDTQTWDGPTSLTDAAGLAWGATIVERTPGTIFAVWSSDATGDKDLYSASSTTGGTSWSTPVRMVDPAFNDDLPFVTTKPDGSLHLVWQRWDEAARALEDYLHLSNELAYATSTDGTTWSTPIALTADPPAKRVPDVLPALVPSGDVTGFNVLWSSLRLGAPAGNVYMTGLSNAPSGGEAAMVQITPDGGYSGRIAVDANGKYLLVWVKDLDIWARRF